MSFAEKVEYARGKYQLSQAQLAKDLGISFATVNRWETQWIEPRYLMQVKFYEFCEQKGIKI